jgi:hypothetical protein
MDGFGWIVAIVVLLLFGKSFSITTAATYVQPNAVPTPDGLPFDNSTDQNQLDPPTAQPAPWRCASPSPSLPMNPVSVFRMPINTGSDVPATSKVRQSLTQFY